VELKEIFKFTFGNRKNHESPHSQMPNEAQTSHSTDRMSWGEGWHCLLGGEGWHCLLGLLQENYEALNKNN
jgi:hypothetical protein